MAVKEQTVVGIKMVKVQITVLWFRILIIPFVISKRIAIGYTQKELSSMSTMAGAIWRHLPNERSALESPSQGWLLGEDTPERGQRP